jgi:hypothetical protein
MYSGVVACGSAARISAAAGPTDGVVTHSTSKLMKGPGAVANEAVVKNRSLRRDRFRRFVRGIRNHYEALFSAPIGLEV